MLNNNAFYLPVMIYYQERPERLNKVFCRIISVVPSQTELLFHLGLEEEVIGITKFCIHPNEWFRNKQRVGGTKNLDIQAIRKLKPDLVIANREENTREQIEEIAREFDVWVSEINNLEQSLDMIGVVGKLTGREKKSQKLIHEIKANFPEKDNLSLNPLKAAYLIWKNPYMTVGGDTFISDMMEKCGLNNIFKNSVRYPETGISELKEKGCELILLSSEPFPFNTKHVEKLKNELPEMMVILVDGEMFSWYGSRLLKAPAYFKQLVSSLHSSK